MNANDKTPIISVQNITNKFGDFTVHDNLSVDIYPGEIVGIVGGSGTGKTVLLRTILGLKKPSEGSIHMFDRDITNLGHLDMVEIFKNYGVLFQNGALFSSLTVAENIMVPLKEHTNLTAEMQKEIADVKISLVGLPNDTGPKYPSELSGGMVKRASLARSLALDPKILFLDEPTSGLDPIAAQGFDELTTHLRDSLGLTIVIITHDLDTLFSICDRVAVLVDKHVIIDTLDNLLQSDHPWIYRYFHGKRAHAVNGDA